MTMPGIALSAVIAVVAMLLEELLVRLFGGKHLIGAAVIAMFIGMILNVFLKNNKYFWKSIMIE